MKNFTQVSLLLSLLLVAVPTVAVDGPVLLRGTLVTMEGEGEVVRLGAVLIEDGVIQEIVVGSGSGQVPEALVVETDGLIFPGLLNIHDHNQFAPFPSLEVDTLYDNRYEWQPDGNGVDLTPFIGINPPLPFNEGSSPFNVAGLYPGHILNDPVMAGLSLEAAKWGEIQALVGGTTTTDGVRPSPGVTDILIRNAEHENFGQDRVCRSVQAVTDPSFAAFAADVVAQAAAGNIDACLIHLAEGVDAASLAEFDHLEALGLLQPWTVIVHGVPFGPAEFARMATAGADLVWSPTSNLMLYGQDARADLALEAGVNVSLGTDWRLSGDHNLLASLKVAWQLNVDRHRSRRDFSPRYERFTPYELVEMVTVNPARSLGWEDRVGRLREGLAADLLVISASPSDRNDPYGALIRATEADVRLVMVGGDALYGDADVMEELKPGDHELIGGPGLTKAIDTTRVGVHKGWQTADELQSTLETAMQFDLQTMFAEYPIVPIVEGMIGPISVQQFAFLFGLVFFDYLPQGTPFPPAPADLGFFFVPGALDVPLNPIFPTP